MMLIAGGKLNNTRGILKFWENWMGDKNSRNNEKLQENTYTQKNYCKIIYIEYKSKNFHFFNKNYTHYQQNL